MRELNIEFLELYRRIDRFIKDAYGSTDGVSEYIRQMEQNDGKGRIYVATWKNAYGKLKHLRWIRNQLVHEVGYDSDICERADYDWLISFGNQLYSATDPLSVMRKAEKLANKNRPAYSPSYTGQRRRYVQIEKKTLWQKIREFFGGRSE